MRLRIRQGFNHNLYFEENNMTLIRKLGLWTLFALMVAGIQPAAFADGQDKGKVLVHGRFGSVTQLLSVPVGDAPGHVNIQLVRVDLPSESQDWRWNGLTTTIYEQLDAYPTQGSFRIYFDANDPAQPARGHAYGFFAGTFSVADDGSAKFSARGNLLGGTGDFDGIAGQVFVDGSITAAEGGRYTMTLILTK